MKQFPKEYTTKELLDTINNCMDKPMANAHYDASGEIFNRIIDKYEGQSYSKITRPIFEHLKTHLTPKAYTWFLERSLELTIHTGLDKSY